MKIKVSDMTKGFIGGCLATLLGFSLSMFWDMHRVTLESKQRERTAITAFKEELTANRTIGKSNLDNLQIELSELNKKSDQSQVHVLPLQTHQNATWSLLLTYFPEKFVKKPDIIIKLRGLTQALDYSNDLLRSREEYRMSDSGNTAFQSRMKIYDDHLVAFEGFLLKQLDDIEPLLQ